LPFGDDYPLVVTLGLKKEGEYRYRYLFGVRKSYLRFRFLVHVVYSPDPKLKVYGVAKLKAQV